MTDPDDRTPAPPPEAASGPVPEAAPEAAPDVDLAAFERDLDAVEAALARLADGTYRTDEITGEPIPDQVLADDPTARRA